MPKLPQPTPTQLDALARIERAAQARRDADAAYLVTHTAYLDALQAAAVLGLSAAQIAPVVGTSYQAVQQILKRITSADLGRGSASWRAR